MENGVEGNCLPGFLAFFLLVPPLCLGKNGFLFCMDLLKKKRNMMFPKYFFRLL